MLRPRVEVNVVVRLLTSLRVQQQSIKARNLAQSIAIRNRGFLGRLFDVLRGRLNVLQVYVGIQTMMSPSNKV